MNESTICRFKKRYKIWVKEVIHENKSPKEVIVNKLRGCPCLLGDKIDPLDQKYLYATRYKRGDINTFAAIVTAKAVQRLGFVCCMKFTEKVRISVGSQKEKDLKFLNQIVKYVENFQIPSSLIINFD